MTKEEEIQHAKSTALNKEGFHSFAAIIGSIVRNDHGAEEEGDQTCVSKLMIQDCDKKAQLSIDLSTKKERENSLYKVRTLIESLEEYEAVLLKEVVFQNHQEIIRTKKQIKYWEEKDQIPQVTFQLKKLRKILKEIS